MSDAFIHADTQARSVGRVEYGWYDIHDDRSKMMLTETWTVFSLKNTRYEFADTTICG